jgi:hypothetical protein
MRTSLLRATLAQSASRINRGRPWSPFVTAVSRALAIASPTLGVSAQNRLNISDHGLAAHIATAPYFTTARLRDIK